MKKEKRFNNPTRKNRKYTFLIILAVFLILIIILRIALPGMIIKYTNNVLQSLKEYTGKVGDVDIRLIRGAFIIRDLMIDKLDEDGKEDTIPLVSVERIDATLDWQSLFRGKIAGKLWIFSPVVKYTSEVHKDKELEADTSDFRKILKKLVPISINRFQVQKGQIHFVDPYAKPMIDIYLADLYINATNLTNVVDEEEPLPAQVTAAANMYNGNFTLDIRLDPLNKYPTFEMQTEMKNLDLTGLNVFFKEYGNFEVRKGKFSMFAEFAGKQGHFGGYVKPFIEDFEIEKQNKGEEVTQRIWELIVGSAMKILENPKTDNVATKIPVEGEFLSAEADIWDAIHYVIRNAFVQALRPTIENSISVNKLQPENKETFLEKVFGGKEEKKEKKKEEKKSKDE